MKYKAFFKSKSFWILGMWILNAVGLANGWVMDSTASFQELYVAIGPVMAFIDRVFFTDSKLVLTTKEKN